MRLTQTQRPLLQVLAAAISQCRLVPVLALLGALVSAANASQRSVLDAMRHDGPALTELADTYSRTLAALDAKAETTIVAPEWPTVALIFESASERAGHPGRGLCLAAITHLRDARTIPALHDALTRIRTAIESIEPVPADARQALVALLLKVSARENTTALEVLRANDSVLLDAQSRAAAAAMVGLDGDAIDRLVAVWRGFDGPTLEKTLHDRLVSVAVLQLLRDGSPAEPLFLFLDGDAARADAAYRRLATGRTASSAGESESFEGTTGQLIADRIQSIVWPSASDEWSIVMSTTERERLQAMALAVLATGDGREPSLLAKPLGVDRETLQRFAQSGSLIDFDARSLLTDEPTPVVRDEPSDTLRRLRERAALLRQEHVERVREARQSMQ